MSITISETLWTGAKPQLSSTKMAKNFLSNATIEMSKIAVVIAPF